MAGPKERGRCRNSTPEDTACPFLPVQPTQSLRQDAVASAKALDTDHQHHDNAGSGLAPSPNLVARRAWRSCPSWRPPFNFAASPWSTPGAVNAMAKERRAPGPKPPDELRKLAATPRKNSPDHGRLLP